MGRGLALRQLLALPQKTEIARRKEQCDADQIRVLIEAIGTEGRAMEAER
jgi:hypothetical protein